MVERRPQRVLDSPHDEFWAYCSRGELRIQQCEACDHLTWPPSLTCERCGDDRLVWAIMRGTGTMVSWCTFERSYYSELTVPWDTILVELDEGPLLISNPAGFGNDEARSGMRVRVCFISCEDDAGPFRLPVFERL